MSQDADFDDLIERLGGFGKYQKRLLYLLLGPLFFIMPFPLMHQVRLRDRWIDRWMDRWIERWIPR